MDMEIEKIRDIPISAGPGHLKKDGSYVRGKVLKLLIPKKVVDKLGIIRYDEKGCKIMVTMYIRPSLETAKRSRNFELIYKFHEEILGEPKEEDIEDVQEDNLVEQTKEDSEDIISSEDFGIEDAVNEVEVEQNGNE